MLSAMQSGTAPSPLVDEDLVKHATWDDLHENIRDRIFRNRFVLTMLVVNFFENKARNLCDGSIQILGYGT